ncbi:MAG: adenylate kinase [Ignavibacteria bacterium]
MYQLIVFGPPGVGKGTQAELIAKKLGLSHISTGEILRKAVSDGTELGMKAKAIMDIGNLVPDEIMNGIVKEALAGSSENGFILDGYPRTVEQARALTYTFSELNMGEVTVINLIADDEEITQRLLKRGRTDDTRETIANRLKVYYKSTEPVKQFYTELGIVKDIYGVGDVDEISKLLLEELH